MPQSKGKRIILSEPFIQKAVIKYLEKKGWSRCLQTVDLRESGVDIKVKNNKYERFWLVEVKGDPSSKVKSPAGSRSSSFNSAVGQILTRMHNNRRTKYIGCEHGNKYGIAFSTYFRNMVIKKMPHWVMRRLCLYIFFVNKKGEVEEINWHKMKNLQNNT